MFYFFKRIFFLNKWKEDKVLIGLDLDKGVKDIVVYDIFKEGVSVRDFYLGIVIKVEGGKI